MKTSLFFIAIIACVCIQAQLDFSDFDDTIDLTDGYCIHWKFNDDKSEITFGLNVTSKGNYFGFGIGEDTTGSMKGADMLIVQYDSEQQQVSIGDYFAYDFATPDLDACQSWNLVSAAYLADSGLLQVIVTRKVGINGDNQDRAVQTDFNRPTKVVWAIGSSEAMSYHGSNRGLLDVYLNGQQQVDPDQYLHVDFLLNHVELSTDETIYYYQSFAAPSLTTDYYIRGFQFIYANMLKKISLHHLVLNICNLGNDSDFQSIFNTPQTTFNSYNCQTSLIAFGTQVPFIMLPENVHFTMGKSGYQYFAIQVHYDNPDHVSGEHDASGVRILYETTPRQYEAGFLQLGDTFLTNPSVIPVGSQFHVEYDCPASMTSQMTTPIQIFSILSHAHLTGSSLWSNLWRASAPDVQVSLTRSEYYDYHVQHYDPMNVTVNPGDRISMHCVYDTSDSSRNVTFGPGTHDEMCITFVMYYPKNAFSFCGYYYDPSTPDTNYTLGPDVFTVSPITNPSKVDNPSGRKLIGGTPFSGTCATIRNTVSLKTVQASVPDYTPVRVGVGMMLTFMALGGIAYYRKLHKSPRYEIDN
jgi:dopamine beta-monooxygenase